MTPPGPNPGQNALRDRDSLAQKADLARMRHDLRTPINHILGYCEMLLEEGQVPPVHREDLRRIHTGGRELLVLITRYFDEEQFFQPHDLHQLYHQLRTPVNHIIGYSDLLMEQAGAEMQRAVPDLQKIRAAAANWLALMESWLIEPAMAAIPNPVTSFMVPDPGRTRTAFRDEGMILVVDDDESSREMLARRLRRFGYTVSVVPDGAHALTLADRQPFDLVMLDMIMPGLDGFQVLTSFKAHPMLRETPVIMLSGLDEENGIARCIEMGAEDYLAKPFNPVFLRARIGACLEKKRLRDRERATYQALLQSQQHLAAELTEAAGYVRSLLPAPQEQPLKVHWRFLPSADLGGDAFGYHRLANGQLAIYLLDVSGHGVGAALLSVSVLNVIRSESLAGTDFCDPASVLGQLNRVFPMDRHNNLIFTMWYAVFDLASRQLTCSSGGHPPAVLLEPAADGSFGVCELSTGGPVLGFDPASQFRNDSHLVPWGSKLYVFSDGAYEIPGLDGRTRQLPDLIEQLRTPATAEISRLDFLLNWARGVRGSDSLEDDLSLMELEL